jgi:hypothetical protein
MFSGIAAGEGKSMNLKKAGMLAIIIYLLFLPSCGRKDTTGTKLLLTRSEILKSSVPTISLKPDDAVKHYVIAQFTRDTKELRAAITKELSDQMGMSDFDYPSFGPSSPWVKRAEITQRHGFSIKSWNYTIKYWMATSQGVLGTKTEYAKVIEIDNKYYVADISKLKLL